jgi:hypothetical protein
MKKFDGGFNMNDAWIGEEENKSGTYVSTPCPEISIRLGGFINAKKLYKFQSRFGNEYYISDVDVLDNIGKLLEKNNSKEITEYMYNLIIEKFGISDFITKIERELLNEHDRGRRSGKIQMQKQMRDLLGLR